jgi:hypothetical protein
VVQQLAAQGFVETSEGYIRLTKRGMKFGNVTFRAFLLDEDV